MKKLTELQYRDHCVFRQLDGPKLHSFISCVGRGPDITPRGIREDEREVTQIFFIYSNDVLCLFSAGSNWTMLHRVFCLPLYQLLV